MVIIRKAKPAHLQTHLCTGSTIISRGLSSPSHMRTVLIVPSKFATSMTSVPASVQYNLRVTQSSARPEGLSRLVEMISWQIEKVVYYTKITVWQANIIAWQDSTVHGHPWGWMWTTYIIIMTWWYRNIFSITRNFWGKPPSVDSPHKQPIMQRCSGDVTVMFIMLSHFSVEDWLKFKYFSTFLQNNTIRTMVVVRTASLDVYYDPQSFPHWGRVMHVCVSKLGQRQSIIWSNATILLIGPLGTNFSEILIRIHTFSFTKIHLKMLSGKWRPFCLGLNVLIFFHTHMLSCAVPSRPTYRVRRQIWPVDIIRVVVPVECYDTLQSL